jgi:WD40 repeat protein
MKVYDVRRRDGEHPIHQVQLNSFDSMSFPQSVSGKSQEGEVTTVSFSPDGLLLAVARSDDELQIFDSRFMGCSAKPMAQYLHWEDDCCIGQKWGIVDAVWVDGWCGRGFGIVTGGSDGEATLSSALPLYALTFILCKVACVSGTHAGQVRTWRMVRCSRGQMLMLAISPLVTLAAERSHLLCKWTALSNLYWFLDALSPQRGQ